MQILCLAPRGDWSLHIPAVNVLSDKTPLTPRCYSSSFLWTKGCVCVRERERTQQPQQAFKEYGPRVSKHIKIIFISLHLMILLPEFHLRKQSDMCKRRKYINITAHDSKYQKQLKVQQRDVFLACNGIFYSQQKSNHRKIFRSMWKCSQLLVQWKQVTTLSIFYFNF